MLDEAKKSEAENRKGFRGLSSPMEDANPATLKEALVEGLMGISGLYRVRGWVGDSLEEALVQGLRVCSGVGALG